MNIHTPINLLIANQVQAFSRPLSAYQAALAWEECADLAKQHKGGKHEDYYRNKLRSEAFFARGEELEAREKEIDLEYSYSESQEGRY